MVSVPNKISLLISVIFGAEKYVLIILCEVQKYEQGKIGLQALSAEKGGMVVPCLFSSKKDTRAGFHFFFHNVLQHYLSTSYQKIRDLFCPVIFWIFAVCDMYLRHKCWAKLSLFQFLFSGFGRKKDKRRIHSFSWYLS